MLLTRVSRYVDVLARKRSPWLLAFPKVSPASFLLRTTATLARRSTRPVGCVKSVYLSVLAVVCVLLADQSVSGPAAGAGGQFSSVALSLQMIKILPQEVRGVCCSASGRAPPAAWGGANMTFGPSSSPCGGDVCVSVGKHSPAGKYSDGCALLSSLCKMRRRERKGRYKDAVPGLAFVMRGVGVCTAGPCFVSGRRGSSRIDASSTPSLSCGSAPKEHPV